MATFADLVTRVNNGEGRDFIDCVGAVVAELAEAWGHQEGSQCEECEHSQDRDGCQTQKMSGVLHWEWGGNCGSTRGER